MDNIMSDQITSQDSSMNNYQVDMNLLNEGVEGDIANSTQEQNSEIEIDPRFQELPVEEARFRTIQSKYDSLQSNYDKTIKELQEKEYYFNLVNHISTDEQALNAFLTEIKPEYVKRIDHTNLIKEKIFKEFGQDFKPSLTREEAERDDPGGKDWLYYRKLDDYYRDIQGKNTDVTTYKEYLKKVKEQENIRKTEYETEINKAKETYKMSDDEVRAIIDFGMKMSFNDLVKIHRFLRRFPHQNSVNNIATIPGSSPMMSERQKFLKELKQI